MHETATWFTIFVACPAPWAPMRTTRRERCASTGRTRSTSAASPPAIMTRVPAAAPIVPPDTGQSIHAMAVSWRRRAAMVRVAAAGSWPKSSRVRVFGGAGSTFTVTSVSAASVPQEPATSLQRS